MKFEKNQFEGLSLTLMSLVLPLHKIGVKQRFIRSFVFTSCSEFRPFFLHHLYEEKLSPCVVDDFRVFEI